VTASGAFSADRYAVNRKVFKLVGGAFFVRDAAGTLVAYSEQKAFKLKEDIRIYADEAKTVELMSIAARQIMDFSAAYDVVDSASGAKIGAMRRQGGKSLLRDEWDVLDTADNKIGTLIEDSLGLALLRRLLTNLVPQRYDVFFPAVEGGTKVASMDQAFNPFAYRLDIDFTFDTAQQFDRRLGIAASILLAAIEGRQS
jgi:uncharacterized protein YxjI